MAIRITSRNVKAAITLQGKVQASMLVSTTRNLGWCLCTKCKMNWSQRQRKQSGLDNCIKPVCIPAVSYGFAEVASILLHFQITTHRPEGAYQLMSACALQDREGLV